MLTDLRGFLALLEEQGDLVRITRPCSPEFEIAAGMRKTSDIDGPALLFENVPGYDMPVVGALLATRRRALWGLESTAENYFARYAHAEARGEPLPMAIAIGTDPYTLMASQVPGSVFLDEMAVAGGLLGAPIEMIRCATIPVEVPATTEIVMEGELLPGERRLEGPYGEFPGYYSSAAPRPIFRVTAITHRRD